MASSSGIFLSVLQLLVSHKSILGSPVGLSSVRRPSCLLRKVADVGTLIHACHVSSRSNLSIRGTVNAFGVFQTYYSSSESRWHASPSNISWIGSIQAFLLLLVGVISGPIYDAGYFRHLITTGAILIPLGFMMTSLANTYWQTMLAQAFLIGLGNG